MRPEPGLRVPLALRTGGLAAGGLWEYVTISARQAGSGQAEARPRRTKRCPALGAFFGASVFFGHAFFFATPGQYATNAVYSVRRILSKNRQNWSYLPHVLEL